MSLSDCRRTSAHCRLPITDVAKRQHIPLGAIDRPCIIESSYEKSPSGRGVTLARKWFSPDTIPPPHSLINPHPCLGGEEIVRGIVSGVPLKNIQTLLMPSASENEKNDENPKADAAITFRGLISPQSIISGILASALFVYFLHPCFFWLWKLVVSMLGRFTSGHIDNFYSSVGKLSSGYGTPSVIEFFHTIGLVATLALGCQFWYLSRRLKILRSSEAASHAVALEDLSRLDKRIFPPIHRLTILSYLLLFILSVTLASQTYGLMYARLTARFLEQNITVLEAYSDDSKTRLFRANWAGLRSEKDFEELVELIEEEAKIQNVVMIPLSRIE